LIFCAAPRTLTAALFVLHHALSPPHSNPQPLQGGVRPLALATWQGHLGVIHALLEAGADVNGADVVRTTYPCGLRSVCWESIACVINHLPCEAAVDYTPWAAPPPSPLHHTQYTQHGLLPLHYAAWRDQRAAAQLLIERGAIINQKGPVRSPSTPLICAARMGHLEMVKLLLGRGAGVLGPKKVRGLGIEGGFVQGVRGGDGEPSVDEHETLKPRPINPNPSTPIHQPQPINPNPSTPTHQPIYPGHQQCASRGRCCRPCGCGGRHLGGGYQPRPVIKRECSMGGFAGLR